PPKESVVVERLRGGLHSTKDAGGSDSPITLFAQYNFPLPARFITSPHHTRIITLCRGWGDVVKGGTGDGLPKAWLYTICILP
ncbi:MAG: hypothetical protein ACK55I_06720, partial [bacterium]